MTGRRVVMAVRSDSFAGVEQYICAAAAELDHRGWHVAVVGGATDEMRRRLPPSVVHRSATTTRQVVAALRDLGRCDLVHAHMTAAETAAVMGRPFTKAQVVSTRHFAARRGSSRWVRAALAPVASSISGQISISRFVAGRIDGASTVILNGVGTTSDQVDDESRRVLVMQRLESEKDTPTALRAWAESRLGAEGWTMDVFGRGAQREALVSLAEELGVASSVRFAGFTTAPAAAMREACVFLATAAAEPFGLSVVEAMAHGMPVVATRSGAHPETLGDAALFFEPGDFRTCAAHLRSLSVDSARRRSLGERARSRQQLVLTVAAHVDQLEQFYASVQSGGMTA